MIDRLLYRAVIEQLAFRHGKMVFLTGPRQVGKTTLAKSLLSDRGDGVYYDWDDIAFRRRWTKDPKTLIPETIGKKPLIIFDEIHKAPHWKTHLKGIFDTKGEFADMVVTGSAKLDVFCRGGDSLMGRYFLFRLHPLSVGEVVGSSADADRLVHAGIEPLSSHEDVFQKLLTFGGFPDPFARGDVDFFRAWQHRRTEVLVREELRDASRIQELSLIEAMLALLPERAGSSFSLSSLREDLQVSHPTVKRWIEWMSRLYYVWKILPYSKSTARSLHKEPKLYLWDWSEISNTGARFENLVASHLLKACHFWTDSGKGLFQLFYLRDKEKREVDFCIVRDRKPWFIAECKQGDPQPTSSLLYFSERLNHPLTLMITGMPNIQETFSLKGSRQKGTMISADKFLQLFP